MTEEKNYVTGITWDKMNKILSVRVVALRKVRIVGFFILKFFERN